MRKAFRATVKTLKKSLPLGFAKWTFDLFSREKVFFFLHQNEEDIKDQLDQISKALANAEQHTVVII